MPLLVMAFGSDAGVGRSEGGGGVRKIGSIVISFRGGEGIMTGGIVASRGAGRDLGDGDGAGTATLLDDCVETSKERV